MEFALKYKNKIIKILEIKSICQRKKISINFLFIDKLFYLTLNKFQGYGILSF